MTAADPARVAAILDRVADAGVLVDDEMSLILRTYARPGVTLEDNRLDLKEAFEDDRTAWHKLCRQIAGLHNTGGGVLLFGVSNTGGRTGLAASLVSKFDPANINNQFSSRRAPAIARTAYTELTRYKKTFGFLAVSGGRQILTFDADGTSSDQKVVIRKGCFYVRRHGQTEPATNAEVTAIVDRITTRGVQTFLARIDRIASLPQAANLIVANPGSSEGYILTNRREGVPVQIIGPEAGAPSVTLSEEVLPDVPLSAPSQEVVGQIREWNTDANHHVPAAILRRWYLSRAELDLPAIPRAAEFIFRSALKTWGIPAMYWARLMDRPRLREVIEEMLTGSPYPEHVQLPWVIAGFFWDDRATLCAGRERSFQKVCEISDRQWFLTRSRSADRLVLPDGVVMSMEKDVLLDRARTGEIFDRCLAADEVYIKDHRSQLHQMDLFLYASDDEITET